MVSGLGLHPEQNWHSGGGGRDNPGTVRNGFEEAAKDQGYALGARDG